MVVQPAPVVLHLDLATQKYTYYNLKWMAIAALFYRYLIVHQPSIPYYSTF